MHECIKLVFIFILFTCREGKRPWSHLTHLLSGRMRTQSHTQKFKFPVSDESANDQSNGLQSSSSMNSDFGDVTPMTQMWLNTDWNSGDVTDDNEKEVDKFRQLLPKSDYALLMRQCRKEYQKQKPSRQQIKLLLKKTFANRRKEIEQMEAEGKPMMSSIIVDWPCFQQGEYVSIITQINKSVFDFNCGGIPLDCEMLLYFVF